MSSPIFKTEVKECRTGSNEFAGFLSSKKEKKSLNQNNRREKNTIESFFYEVKYRKKLMFFFKETFHCKAVTAHVSYWIFENRRCLCLDPKELSSNAESS